MTRSSRPTTSASVRPSPTSTPAPRARLPEWLALGLALLGGVGSAAQSAANAEIGSRVGAASMGAVVNNAGGILIVLLAVLFVPSTRAGLATLWRARLPWWTYLGGIGGAFFLVVGTYVIPVLGVAVFTIAQVAGGSAGGLAVDRAGLAPVGRLALTVPRLAGALLAIGAVTLAQLGRPVGELAVGSLLLAVAGGTILAIQAALNGRLSAIGGTSAGTAVNFMVGTSAVAVVATALGAFARFGEIDWPGAWYLYVGGPLGVAIVVALLICVRSVGVLRAGLAIVAGQLGGALLLDAVLVGSAPRPAVMVAVVLTLAAVVVSGRRARGAPTA